MADCNDCKHPEHKPGECPFDNCGESEVVHSRDDYSPSSDEFYVPDYLS